MATRDETAKELARLVRELTVAERDHQTPHHWVRSTWHLEPAWNRMQELARQLLGEPD